MKIHGWAANMYKELYVPLVKKKIAKYIETYLKQFNTIRSSLNRNILNTIGHNRLRRKDTVKMFAK